MITHIGLRFRASTNRAQDIYELITKYQKSICKGKLDAYGLSPLPNILTSWNYERVTVQSETFAGIQELELRDRRITSILNGGFLCTGASGTPEAKEVLRRALFLADRLGDCASLGPDDEAPCCPYRAHAVVRERQIAVLQNLADTDLAFLVELVSLAGMGFARWKAAEMLSDPDGGWDKRTAFEETMLRQGSFLIWAYVRGDGCMGRLMQSAVQSCLGEIRQSETGDHLKTILVGELRRRLCPEEPEDKVYREARKLVGIEM